MKKLLLITGLALGFISCEPDEIKTPTNSCGCGEIIESHFSTYQAPNNQIKDCIEFKMINNCSGDVITKIMLAPSLSQLQAIAPSYAVGKYTCNGQIK